MARSSAVSFDPAGLVAALGACAARSRLGQGAPRETQRVRTATFSGAELAGGGHLEPLVVDRLDDQALRRACRARPPVPTRPL